MGDEAAMGKASRYNGITNMVEFLQSWGEGPQYIVQFYEKTCMMFNE